MKKRKMCNILAVVTVIAAVSVILIYGKKIEPSVQNTDIKKFVIMGTIAIIIVAFCIFSIFYFLHGSLELNL